VPDLTQRKNTSPLLPTLLQRKKKGGGGKKGSGQRVPGGMQYQEKGEKEERRDKRSAGSLDME